MKQKTKQLLTKAKETIETAELLLDNDKRTFAASCAYYAMFYVAEALLFEEGLEFRKHSGVQAAFGKHFAKTGKLDPKFHRYLLEAFEIRLEADYEVDISPSENAVKELIQQAKEFWDTVEHYLTPKTQSTQ